MLVVTTNLQVDLKPWALSFMVRLNPSREIPSPTVLNPGSRV